MEKKIQDNKAFTKLDSRKLTVFAAVCPFESTLNTTLVLSQ